MMLLWERRMGRKCVTLLSKYIGHIQKCKTSFRKTKLQLQSLFKQKGFQIILECNLKVPNYLDNTFILNDGFYQS